MELFIYIFAPRFCSSMDRMQDSDSCDEGSNPSRTALSTDHIHHNSKLMYKDMINVGYFVKNVILNLPTTY